MYNYDIDIFVVSSERYISIVCDTCHEIFVVNHKNCKEKIKCDCCYVDTYLNPNIFSKPTRINLDDYDYSQNKNLDLTSKFIISAESYSN